MTVKPLTLVSPNGCRWCGIPKHAEPPKYHATTAWAPDHTGESAEPYCADCKTDVCHRWARIQVRLDQQRWGIPRRTSRSRKTPAAAGGWGGGDSWPF